MITLNGACGDGTLLGTFFIPDEGASGEGYCSSSSHLDYMTPPSDWKLPPPDSVWYDVTKSKYGPQVFNFDIGSLISSSDPTEPWKPCQHSTIRGNAHYRGLSGSTGPYWAVPKVWKTAFTGTIPHTYPPSPCGKFLSAMVGRPSNGTSNVYGYNGQEVKISVTSNNDGNRYWLIDSVMCASIASDANLLTLTQLGQPYELGQWYCISPSGLVTDVDNQVTIWFKTDWTRADRCTFVREQLIEYHSSASYTPRSSVGWSGHPFLVEANKRRATCVITHIRSDAAGRFQVKYDLTTTLSWFGWEPWADFKGEKTITSKGKIYALLIPKPGLTAKAEIDTIKADYYCNLGRTRARALYTPNNAVLSRTAAIRDTQTLDSNWLENLSDVKGTMDCITPLLDGIKAVDSGDIALARQALASAYLVYSYAIRPGISDANNIRNDGSRILKSALSDRFSNERRRGLVQDEHVRLIDTTADITYTTTYHFCLKHNYFSQIWSALEKLRLDPSSGQVWDLIPFSFVADWFLPIGDTLRCIDAYNSSVINRDLRARIEGFKVQWPIGKGTLSDLFDRKICPSGSPLVYSWYDRRVYQTIGSIDPVAINDCNGLTLSQMVQGSALLTQMR